VLISQTWMAIRLGKFDQALEKARRSQEIYERTGAPPVKGMGMDPKISLTVLHQIHGEYRQAVTLATVGLAACQARGDKENLPFFYYTLASATSALGDFHTAGEYAQKAIDLCVSWTTIVHGILHQRKRHRRACPGQYEAAKWHFYDSYTSRPSRTQKGKRWRLTTWDRSPWLTKITMRH
jgi:hypothetical protein